MARRKLRQPKKLRRSTGRLRVKKTLLVFCEGSVTEPGYFSALKGERSVREGAAVEIQIDKDRSGAVPMTLISSAIQMQATGQASEVDEIWCVFDVECPQEHPNLKNVKEKAKRHGIKLAISNPCFELWLLLHLDQHTAALTTAEACSLLKKKTGSTGKELEPDLYLPKRVDALRRARELSLKHQRDGSPFPRDNPSSGMFKLLESIEK